MTEIHIYLGAIILFAYTVEAITGFGSIVIALSLGALFLPIPELLPVLAPLNVLQSFYLITRHRDQIHLPTLFGQILPMMVVGMAFGYLLRPMFNADVLRATLGALILWFAGRELWRMLRNLGTTPHSAFITRILMFAAGISHGMFGSGGPLLAYSLTGTTLDKQRLRATLIAVWFSLNSLLTILFLIDGSLNAAFPSVVLYAPLLVVGIWLGEKLHHKVDERRFRQMIFTLLMGTGGLLVFG